MTTFKILSWNVGGMGSPKKRIALFMHIRKYNPHVICLQETHLIPEKVSQLLKPWVQWSVHFTHSSYSRGVSLLVHRNFRWEVGQIQKDPKGRFIFIQACIDSLPYVLLGIYLPPPSNLSILQHAARFANQFQQATLICIGDFNMLKDPVLDSFSGAHEPVAQSTSTALSQFLAEMGWYYLLEVEVPQLYYLLLPLRQKRSV